MGEQISFKTRVKNVAIQNAKDYYSYYKTMIARIERILGE